mgnify:CR=1 FL=1
MEGLIGLVTMLIPIVAIAFPIIIVYIIFHFIYRSEKQFHDTLQEMIKNGQVITPELLSGIPGYAGQKQKRDDVRTGIITAATGVGVALFGIYGVDEAALLGIGLLIFSIGSGILVYGVYNKNKETDDIIK